MTIPTLGTWADSLAPAIPSLIGGIHNLLRPDDKYKAQLNEMLAKNPMLAEQFSNMDPQAREALAKGLGFHNLENASPIMNAGTGEKLQARYDQKFAEESLTSDQKEELQAKKAGVSTQSKINSDKTTAKRNEIGLQSDEQGLKLNAQEIRIRDNKLKDLDREMGDIEKSLLKFPNITPALIQKARDNYIQGITDPDLLRLLPPESIKAFESYGDMLKQKIGISAQFGLQSMRTPAEKQFAVKMIMDKHDNAFAALQNAQTVYKQFRGTEDFKNRIIKKGPELAAYEEEKSAAYSALLEAQRNFQQADIQYNNIQTNFDPTGEKPKEGKSTTPLPTIATVTSRYSPEVENLKKQYDAKGIPPMAITMSKRISQAEKDYILGKSK